MPWTLYKYILRELLKLLGLTTAVLVVVMSFAAAIQPMSDGQLSPGLLVKFVLFTAPTVLGFALPFAGAFASTLVFIRLAGDNEILACSASGISYLRILAPVLALGVALTGGMFYLANYTVPMFYRMAERTVEGDVISLLVSQLNQRQFFEFKGQGLVIYADSATEFPPQESPGSVLPMTQLVELKGVVVGETEEGRVLRDVTAESAAMAVYGDSDTGKSFAVLRLTRAVRNDPSTGVLVSLKWMETKPIEIRSLLSDNPKFLSASDLDKYEKEPERYDVVSESMRTLSSAMATESLRRAFVVVKDNAVLNGALPGDRFVLSVPVVEEDGEVLKLSSAQGQPIRMKFYTNGQVSGPPLRTYEAELAYVRVRANAQVWTNAPAPAPSIDIELLNVKVVDGSGGLATGNKSLLFRQLAWPAFIPEDLDKRKAKELLGEAHGPDYASSKSVAAATENLDYMLAVLRRDITGQRHERAAAAVSCSLLLLLGSVLSMRLKDATPLVVYFWSFLLAWRS